MEELTEVLNHVITLGFAMNQEVEADLLLETDNSFDLLLNKFLVLVPSDLALPEFGTSLPNLLGLLDR